MRITKYFLIIAASLLLGACQPNYIIIDDPNMPSNAYLEGEVATVGVVLCHGRGRYPTWMVVNPLRKGLHKQLGYHTLSIQMPTGNVSWFEYRAFFPDAHKRIAAAVRYLREVKKVEKIYLMGHSMGSRMATSFLADNPDSGIAGFIGVGIRNGGGIPLDSNSNLRLINIPVIDIYGDGGDGQDAADAYARADMVDENYQQVLISGADHNFTYYKKEMVMAVVNWLEKANIAYPSPVLQQEAAFLVPLPFDADYASR
jgi:pimeloyl-ACP methyl ester carboxylesterase